jgi:hypothetical protein
MAMLVVFCQLLTLPTASAVLQASKRLRAIMDLLNLSDGIAAFGERNSHKGLDGIPDSQELKPGARELFCGECKTVLALTFYVVDVNKVREARYMHCVAMTTCSKC